MNYQRPPLPAGANTTPSGRRTHTRQTSIQEKENVGGDREGKRGNAHDTDDRASEGGRGGDNKGFLTPKSTVKTPNNTVNTHQAKRSFNYHNSSTNQLEYFTNNHFSRSFNSLILDDIKGEMAAKKPMNKSPPFNVKHDYYEENDALDDFSDGVDFESDAANSSDTASDHFDGSHVYQSPVIAEIKPKNVYRRDTRQSSVVDADGTSVSYSNPNSQHSSIKRSSKFLNLSIDSTRTLDLNATASTKILEDDIDCISDLNEIGSQFSNTPANSVRRSGANRPSSASPIENKTPLNKFKRPHQLVSQSPSPSSQTYLTSKHSFYNQQPHQDQGESMSGSLSNSIQNSMASSRTNSVLNLNSYLGANSLAVNVEQSPSTLSVPSTVVNKASLYSPTKLGGKGFKMFKNADKDAIISPNRSISRSNITDPAPLNNDSKSDDANVRPSTSLGIFDSNNLPKQSYKLALRSIKLHSTSNKLRKTSGIRSPFTPNDQLPSFSTNLGFEYYNLDNLDIMDLEDDSPSKNKKIPKSSSANSNTNSIQVYQESEHDMSKTRKKLKNYDLQKDLLYSDDKENVNIKSLLKKSSYKFVKPLQTAFKSTGLVKKNSVNNNLNDPSQRKIPPETPIKRHPMSSIDTHTNNTIHCTSPIGNGLSKELKASNLSNIVSSAHDDTTTFDDNLELSIEIGRNNSSYLPDNDSNTSVFKISSAKGVKNKNKATELDLDMVLDDAIPETPTKSVKKSHSIPANFSPISYNRTTVPSQKSKVSSLRSSEQVDREPSTPIFPLYNSNVKMDASSSSFNMLDSVSSQQTLCNEVSEPSKIDDHLMNKFGMKNIKYLGSGEFSIAYECSFQDQKFAIKKTKKQVYGKLERKAIMREVEALRVLTSVKDNEMINLQEQDEGKENLVYFIEAWDFNNYFYIMTEYCEGGTLFDFLEEHKNYKLDEFRIWKILIEILNGLKFIHLKNYLHLDLKPANIFITFEGYLKIGDFGLATKLPILEKDFDLEGDRNYIAPELINDKIYTPFADIFSVGLIILEIAANIILPDNGSPWRKLRSGDLSDAGKLSSDNISDFLQHQNFSSLTSYNSSDSSLYHNHFQYQQHLHNHQHHPMFRKMDVKNLIPAWAPEFLVSGDTDCLDKLVSNMLKPNPFDRPNAKMILESEECMIIENRRKAGATIFEGEFGPNDDN